MNEPKKNAWVQLRQSWLHIELPGYRQAEGRHHTYFGFSLEELPPIPITLDDQCDWLIELGRPLSQGLHRYERNIAPSIVRDLATELKLELPNAFVRFMSSLELQQRVRSATDCYLDPGERIVETIGAIPGHLTHFLSDSQSGAHWYLHLLANGDSAVLESEDLYCYRIENSDWMENPACRLERIDLTKQEFAFCAPSFSEFLYRFWIENEIWFASYARTARPLTPLEQNYVRHYETLQHKA